jgi:hypothetical protein
MKDKYKKQLTSNQEIYLLLLSIIPNTDVCKKITIIKKKKEDEEIMTYHCGLWYDIALKFYKAKKNNFSKFSYVVDGVNFVIRLDHDVDFFRNTGVSYQIKDMIHDLIRVSTDKKWLKYDDTLYSILSKKIMDRMIIINYKVS